MNSFSYIKIISYIIAKVNKVAQAVKRTFISERFGDACGLGWGGPGSGVSNKRKGCPLMKDLNLEKGL